MFILCNEFWQTGRKFGFFLIFCFGLGGCDFSADESRNIKVTIVPDRPQVFESAQTGLICRRDQSTNNDDLLATDSQVSLTQESSDEQINGNTFPKIDVNEGWFKVGLSIENKSDYLLVVDSLVFTISAAWGDDKVLSSKKEFVSGYCNADPLYSISPKQQSVYQPDNNHSSNSLQLYIDGISLPKEPPRFTDTRATLGFGTEGDLGNSNNSNNANINQIPSYRVELSITGRFVDGQRNLVSNFRSKKTFNTR